MFFKLTNTVKDNFPCQHNLPNGLVLNTDDGWEMHQTNNHHVVYKGYANNLKSHQLITHAINNTHPSIKGNFCAFVSDTNTTNIMHDTNRSFPLWLGKNEITNLQVQEEQIWADCILNVDKDFTIHKQWYQPYQKNTQQLTDAQIIDRVHQTIMETYEQFLTHNTKPLKIFVSGGLDTVTNWAYLDHFTKNYELIDYEYMKYTDFYTRNLTLLKKQWGYQQIHLWDHDCVLVSGGNGDENFLRGPYTLAMALKQHGIELKDILEPKDYHYWYFSKKDITDSVNTWYADTDDVDDWILNRNINDHQHWHLDKTITFTPFKDISILALILNVSKELLIKQARQGEINRQLIKKLDHNKLGKISKQKNLNHRENM